MQTAKTLFKKIWDAHVVTQQEGAPAVLYIDLQLVHEVTSPQAFSELRKRNLSVRRPDRTFATVDHGIPTLIAPEKPQDRLAFADDQCRSQISQLDRNCKDFAIPYAGVTSKEQGVVHVIGPDLGLTQPGMTIVCGDSHTATHGAFGALAFGIGTSEVGHVLATQCLLQHEPKTMEVRVTGELQPGVTPKDVILALIAKIGVGGGTGHVIEYTGETIRNMSMEGRMTVCNMSIECGARAGMIAPDEITFAYLKDKKYAPQGEAWDAAVEKWKQLTTDEGAEYDTVVELDVSKLSPMITFGTNPSMGVQVFEKVPTSKGMTDENQKAAYEKALKYMGFDEGQMVQGQKVDVVFIGSCTNSRISDLRLAAEIFRKHKVAETVRCLVVPGSYAVKEQAEVEGLADVFKKAGAEWREPGCSMCIAMNGDQIQPGQYAVSTSNRNFEGRQGKGGRTMLASPLMAAAAAVTGKVTDPRELL
jgi:3-isopropylmalate/(R)-2-methylmalate dehydratase large subunit